MHSVGYNKYIILHGHTMKSTNHVEIYLETLRIQRGSTTVPDFLQPETLGDLHRECARRYAEGKYVTAFAWSGQRSVMFVTRAAIGGNNTVCT